MKYEIYEFHTQQQPVYIVQPRKGVLKTLLFFPTVLGIDFMKKPTLTKVLNKLYKKGYRFAPKESRVSADKEYEREMHIVRTNSTSVFKTKKYNPSKGRIGFDKDELMRLYRIKTNKKGMYIWNSGGTENGYY